MSTREIVVQLRNLPLGLGMHQMIRPWAWEIKIWLKMRNNYSSPYIQGNCS